MAAARDGPVEHREAGGVDPVVSIENEDVIAACALEPDIPRVGEARVHGLANHSHR